jgi:hypothetical protein
MLPRLAEAASVLEEEATQVEAKSRKDAEMPITARPAQSGASSDTRYM